jgi:hypothetical protein
VPCNENNNSAVTVAIAQAAVHLPGRSGAAAASSGPFCSTGEQLALKRATGLRANQSRDGTLGTLGWLGWLGWLRGQADIRTSNREWEACREHD